MIQPCNFLAPDGTKSVLAQSLIEQYGPERALSVWDNLYSTDVTEHIFDWKTDTRFNAESGELHPKVATYLQNISTAREQWVGLKADASLGEMKLRREYNADSARQLERIYEGAKMIVSKDTYGRSMYKVTIPMPKFSEEVATSLMDGKEVGQFADHMTTPAEYITPEIPDEVIEPKLANAQIKSLSLGKTTQFTQPTNMGMSQGDRAMVYVDGKPMIATYNGQGDQGEHRFLVNNPYKVADITTQELGLTKDTVTPGLASDSTQLQASLGRMFAQVRGEDGQPIEGQYFTPQQQTDAVDAVLTDLYGYLRGNLKNGDTLTAGMLLSGLRITRQKLNAFNNGLEDVASGVANENFLWNDLAPKDAMERSGEIVNVLRSYDQIAGFALERLRAYGFNIDGQIRDNITDYLNKGTEITDAENGIDENSKVEITGDEGRGLRDWSDSSFELDPRDTASKRMKFFLATIKDAEVGTEEVPKKVRMVFGDPEMVSKIIKGTKVYTVRTPEQAERIKVGPDGRGSVTLDGKTYVVQSHESLQTTDQLDDWQDLFDEEKVDPTPGSVVYKLSSFKPKENVLVNKKSALGFPRLAPFEQVFTDVLAQVQNATGPNFQAYIDALSKSGNPTMMKVAQELLQSDQQLRNEFFKVMSKQYQRMRIVLFDSKMRNGEQEISGQSINANRFNEIDTVINGWREGQKASEQGIVQSKDGRLQVDQAKAQEHFDQFQRVTKFDWTKANQGQMDSLLKWTGKFLSDIGVPLTPEALNDFRQNAEKLTKGSQFAGSWFKQYSMTSDGRPNGLISALATRLAGIGTPDSQIDETADPEADFLQNNNPLYTENTAMRILAKAQAKFVGSLFAPMHKSAEGKSIYAYGLHTYESHTFDNLVNSEDFRKQYDTIPFARKSWLLAKLKKADQRQVISLDYFDAIKPAYKKGGGTTRTDMSPREQELAAILSFQNRGNKYGSFFDLTKSDKSTTPVIHSIEKTVVKNFNITPEMSGHFHDVFQSEFDRIKHWEDNKDSFNNKNYKAGAGLFYLMPQFNFEEMSRDLKEGKVSREQFNSVWNDDGSVSRVEDVVTRAEVVNQYVQDHIREMALNTRERWREMGLFDNEDTKFDSSWVKKARRNLGLFPSIDEQTNRPVKDEEGNVIWNKTIKNGTDFQQITKAHANELVASLAALEYSSNYFLHTTSMSQLISGDPALAYKGKKGMTQLEQVDVTMKEYQKRLAKDIGPGADPSWDRNATYNTITIADPNYKSYLGEVIPSYGEFDTAADAQEVTTVKEHLDVMFAQGLIPDKVYHDMVAQIPTGDKAGSYYEFTEPAHRAIVMQAQKPVQVGADFNNGVMEIHYIKTSSYPLLPELTAGKEIDKLRQMMETGNIHRAAFKSGVKLSSPEVTADLFDEQGNFKSETNYQPAVQQLKREGFRIQQEVPYDEEKEKILTVSQMNKLIVEGIGDMDGFKMPGDKTYSGKEMRTIKEETRTQMLDIQRGELLKSIGAKEWTGEQGGYVFTNPEKLLTRLEQEAVSRNYPPNDLDAIRTRMSDGRLVLPLFLNGSADRFESLMMSMVKQVVQVKMPGKSFIQASSLGYTGHKTFDQLTTADKSGIIYSEGHDPSGPLRSMQQGEGQSKAAQVLVPFNFFGKDGKALDIKNFTKTTEDGRVVIDSEKLPDELRRFVGARIPNQEHSSMLPIEIVGFIPKQLGDLMIVPAEITQQMGSDFDVDKLYVYKPGYKVDGNKLKAVSSEPEEGKAADMKQLQQRYFDVHWSVLTHPDMFNRVLSPLDKPELKNEKALAEANQGGKYKNYYDVSTQMDDFMSQKDAKTLVGATALTNTFNAVVQDKNLRLGHSVLQEDGSVKEVADYILFKDEVSGETLKLTNLSGTGKSTYYPHEDPKSGDEGMVRSKSNNISTQLSEVVDHAKNRTIDFLNFNQYTYGASSAMSLLETKDGKALNLKYNSRLMQQPIVREFASQMAKGNDSLSREFISYLKSKVFSELQGEYISKMGEEKFTKIAEQETPKSFSPQELQKLIETKSEDRDEQWYADQYEALRVFQQLDTVGDKIRQIQSKLSQDTRGAGSDLLASLNTQADLPDAISNGVILGVEGIAGNVDKNGNLIPTTEVGHTYKTTVELANQLYSDVMPYDKLQPLFSNISLQMGRDKIIVDNQRRIADAVRSHLFSDRRNGLFENASRERGRLLFDTEAGKSLARRVADAQSGLGKENYFLKRLATHIATTDEQASTLTYNATGASSLDDFEVTKAWASLLTSADPELKALGEDLIRYTYATGGMQTAQNFAKFVPVGYIAGLPMAKELTRRVDNLAQEMSIATVTKMSDQIFQHNPDMARQMVSDFKQTIEHPEGVKDGRIPEKFTLKYDPTDPKVPATNLLITDYDASGAPTLRYPDFLSIRQGSDWLLYKQNDREAGEGTTSYNRIDLLGKGDVLEYDASRAYTRSVFPENRALRPFDSTSGSEIARTPSEYSRNLDLSGEVAGNLGLTYEQSDADLSKEDVYNTNFMISKSGTPMEEVMDVVLNDADIEDGTHEVLSQLYEIATDTSRIIANEPLPTMKLSLDPNNLGTFKYGMKIDPTGNVGYSEPEIHLNMSKMQTEEQAARLMIHELAHYNSSLALRGYDAWVDGKIEKPNWMTKRVQDSIEAIEELRKRTANLLDPTSSAELKYAVSNKREFVAAIFENKDLQSLLNGQKSTIDTAKSLLQTVIDGIKDIVDAISEYLGVSVKAGSVLNEALFHSAVIMGTEAATPEATGITRGGTEQFSENMSHFGSEPGVEEPEYPEEIGRAIGNLTTLMNKLKSKQVLPSARKMGEVEAKEYQLRGAEIARMEYDLGRLREQGTLANLVGIGSRQMKMIDGMLTEGNLSQKQLENLLDTADTWEHMVDDLYENVTNGTVPTEAQLLRGQAAERKGRITNLVKESEINNPESVINSMSDFTAEQMKIGAFGAYTVDLSHASGMVAQRIDTYLKNATRLEKEETRRTRAELAEYQAKVRSYAKSKGLTDQQVFDKMMEQGKKWGLVSIFSDDYYQFKKNTFKSLMGKLKAADGVEDENIKKGAISEAYRQYREQLNKNIVYVDTSRLFDPTSGDELSTPDAKGHRAELEKELGKDLTDTMVEQAQRKYTDFLRDRYSYKSAIQVQVRSLLSDFSDETETRGDMSAEEQQEAIAQYKADLTKQFNDEYTSWEGNNSPDVFFRSLRGEFRGHNPKFNNFSAIVDAPKRGAGDGTFYDKRFVDIQEDPQLRSIYEFIQNKLDEFKYNLPAHVTGDMFDNFLPIVRKEAKASLKVGEMKEAIAKGLTNALSSEAGPIEYSRTNSGMIPIRYVKGSEVEIEHRDRDIFRQIEKFAAMSQHYKRATEVQSGVELLHRIMVDKIEDTKGGVFDRINNGTKNLSDMVAYAKDRLLYQKGREAEGELGTLHSLNPIKQYKLEHEVVVLKEKLADLDTKYAEGEIDLEAYNTQQKELMAQIAAVPSRVVTASKLGDVAIKITELKALSYNPFSGFANLSFGLVSTMIHANGQTDFNKRAAMDAFTTMLHATGRAVTLGGVDTNTAKKILALMEKYDVMGDLLDSDYAGASRIHGKKSTIAKVVSPYQLLRNSDYFMKGMILVAMMKHQKVDMDGKEVPLWDAYDHEGNWKGTDVEQKKLWDSHHADEEKEFSKFQAKAVAVSKIIMGNQDHASTMMIKKTILGRLVSQFRASWLSEGFATRFEGEQFNSQLGRTTKGRYVTYKDLGVIGSMTTLFRQGMSTFLSIDPFSGKKRNGEALKPVDIDNMRRNFAEVASYMTVMAAVVALRMQLKKDDPDSPEARRNKAFGMTLLNLIIRNRQDIEFYASPNVFSSITSSLIPSMKVWMDFQHATQQTVKYMSQDEETSKNPIKGSKVAEGWMRAVPYGAVYPKFKTMWSQDIDSFQN